MVSTVRIDTAQAAADFDALGLRAPPDIGFSAVLDKACGLMPKSLEYKAKGAEESIEYPTDRADGTASSSKGITESAGQKQPKAAEQEGDETILIQALVEVDYPLLFQTDTALPVNTLDETAAKPAALGSENGVQTRPAGPVFQPSAENRPDFCAAACEIGAGEPLLPTQITAQTVGQAAEKANAADNAGGLGFAEKTGGKATDTKADAAVIGKSGISDGIGGSIRPADGLDVNRDFLITADSPDIDTQGFKTVVESSDGPAPVNPEPIDVKVSGSPRFTAKTAEPAKETTKTGIPAAKPDKQTKKTALNRVSGHKAEFFGPKPAGKAESANRADEPDTIRAAGLNPVFKTAAPAASLVSKAEDTPLPVNAGLPVREQIVDDVRANFTQGRSTFSIRLNPKELGELFVKITMDDGKVFLQMNTSLPSTRDLIFEQLDQLKQALAGSGIHVADLSVNCSGGAPPCPFGFSLERGFGGNAGGQRYRQEQPEEYLGQKEEQAGFLFKPARLDYKI